MKTSEQFIADYWEKLGAKKVESSHKAHVVVDTALLELIANGTDGRSYIKFCNYISEKTGILVEDVKGIYDMYRYFLLQHVDNALLSDMFFTRNPESLDTDLYDTLCYSAGYLRRIMKKERKSGGAGW